MIFPNIYTDVHIFCYRFQTVSQQRNTRDKWGLYKPSIKKKEKEKLGGKRRKEGGRNLPQNQVW